MANNEEKIPGLEKWISIKLEPVSIDEPTADVTQSSTSADVASRPTPVTGEFSFLFQLVTFTTFGNIKFVKGKFGK